MAAVAHRIFSTSPGLATADYSVGLDIVELVMEWEEAFSINIGDDEAATLSTPAEVCDLVEQK